MAEGVNKGRVGTVRKAELCRLDTEGYQWHVGKCLFCEAKISLSRNDFVDCPNCGATIAWDDTPDVFESLAQAAEEDDDA